MLEIEDRRISKELHSDEQSADRRLDNPSQLPFTTASAINIAVALAPRLVVELG